MRRNRYEPKDPEGTVTSALYMRKLKARLAELIAKRTKAKAKYAKDLVKWRRALHAWVLVHGSERARNAEVDSRYYKNGAFNMLAFFAGAPDAPKKAIDPTIAKVQNRIRQLQTTEQKTVTPDSWELDQLFGVKGEDED